MELEIKVRWCKGLTSFNFFQKLTVYAAVYISSEDEKIQLTQDQKQEQKTPVDENGDGDPEWNFPMKFDLHRLSSTNLKFNDLCLAFELRNTGQLFGEKSVGEVRVCLKDLVESVGGEFVRFVSYEVRNSEGKHNGILDFSYKVIGTNNNDNIIVSSNHNNYITGYNNHHHHEYDQQVDPSYTNSDVHVIGYHHHQHQGHEHGTNYSDVHVIGYHHHHHHSSNLDDLERIQYPKIDIVDYNNAPLVYPPPSSSFSSSSSSSISAHYHSSAPEVYPPPPQSQMWAPPPPPPQQSHYLPPQQHYVYPPPQPQEQPYADLHWGYQRPPDQYHHW